MSKKAVVLAACPTKREAETQSEPKTKTRIVMPHGWLFFYNTYNGTKESSKSECLQVTCSCMFFIP